MLFVAPELLVLVHLGVELLFVAEEGVSSDGHLLSLLSLLFLLSLDDLQVHFSVDAGFLLHSGIVVRKLPLASRVKRTEVLFVLDTLGLQLGTSLKLSCLERLLSSNLVEFSLTVLSSLLELAKALDFSLFFFFDTGIFSHFCFFTLQLKAIELGNFGVSLPFGFTSSLLLGECVSICDFNLLVHYLNSLLLRSLSLCFLPLDLLNVLKHEDLLALEDLFFLLALHLALHNLIDDNGSSPFASFDRPFISFVLGLNRLQSLNLHH